MPTDKHTNTRIRMGARTRNHNVHTAARRVWHCVLPRLWQRKYIRVDGSHEELLKLVYGSDSSGGVMVAVGLGESGRSMPRGPVSNCRGGGRCPAGPTGRSQSHC